jgi:hypothetical protein
MKNNIIPQISLAVVICAVCMPVRAQLITISITGQVSSVIDEGGLDGKIHIGDSVTGTYTYNSAVPDLDPCSIWGRYENTSPPAGIWLECGGFDFRTDPCNVRFVIGVENGTPGVNLWADDYHIESYNNLPLSNGRLLNIISWKLIDLTKTALSSDACPTTAPDFSKWGDRGTLCIDGMRGGGFRIGVNVTLATLIPEPATICLFGLGVLNLIRRKK